MQYFTLAWLWKIFNEEKSAAIGWLLRLFFKLKFYRFGSGERSYGSPIFKTSTVFNEVEEQFK